MQCAALVAEGAVQAATAAELVQQVDIAFACLADPAAALQVSRGLCAVAASILFYVLWRCVCMSGVK